MDDLIAGGEVLADMATRALQAAIWNEPDPDLRAYLARVLPLHSGYRHWHPEATWTPDGLALRLIVDLDEYPGDKDACIINISLALSELPPSLRDYANARTAEAEKRLPSVPDSPADLFSGD